jgi:hypothetical protein
MSSESERFIELATRPLDPNAELKLAAAEELRRRIEAQAAAEELIAESARALEHADKHPRRRYWRVALYLATLLVSLPMIVQSIRQVHAFTYVKDMISSFSTLSEPVPNPIQARLTPEQKLLLFGDESARNPWKPLWDSAPDNPAYLAEYAKGYFREHKNLSPEILAAAERIDPDNGWFIALSAGAVADGAVTRGKLTTKEQKELKAPVWTINDPNKLRETLQLIRQVAQKPRFCNYEAELMRQRIPLLPKRIDCVSQIPPIAYVASQNSAVIHLRKLVDAMCAGAQECAANRDIEGFKQITNDWDALNSRQIGNSLTMIDLLVARVSYLAPAENFRDTALSLGLDQEAKRFTELVASKKAEKEARDKRSSSSEHITSFRGSLLASFTIPMLDRQVQNPPPLSEADLQPSRYADHALLMRVVALATWLLLGLVAGLAALHRFIQNPLVRMQSVRMLDLLKFSDWLWILLGGVLVPVLWQTVFIYLTPLSSREWTFKADGFNQAGCQPAAMILLMLTLTVVLCASRLAKRGAAIGLSTRFAWLGWIAAACAALALPASGSALPAAFSQGPLKAIANYLPWLGFVLLTIPALWLFIGFSRTVLGRHVHALRRATLARMVLPAWIFGMLVMMVSIPIYHAEERHWIKQDKLFEITAEAPAMSRYEWDVTQQLRKELLEMMR